MKREKSYEFKGRGYYKLKTIVNGKLESQKYLYISL